MADRALVSRTILRDSAGNEVSVSGGALQTTASLDVVTKDFELKTNVYADTLNNGGNLLASAVGLITFTNSTASFPTTGYIGLGSGSTLEIIEYDKTGAGANQLNILTRGVWGTTDKEWADGSAVGEVYTSDVLTLDTWSQVITKISSDQDCSLHFQWYSDLAGTTIIRTLTPTFLSSDGYDFLSTVAFAPYVRYSIFSNTGVATSKMYFTTEFARTAVHPQLLTVNDEIFSSMVSSLQRSVLTGATEGGSFLNVGVSDQAELFTNTLAANRKTTVSHSATGVAADTYYLMIDLDNSGGAWPHQHFVSVDVDHITASVNFASGTATAGLLLGVITRVDGTDADVSYLWSINPGVQSANDGIVTTCNFQPSSVTFKTDGAGNVVGALTSIKESAVAAINTGTTLNGPGGAITPAVGDVILKADYNADTFDWAMTVVYHAD